MCTFVPCVDHSAGCEDGAMDGNPTRPCFRRVRRCEIITNNCNSFLYTEQECGLSGRHFAPLTDDSNGNTGHKYFTPSDKEISSGSPLKDSSSLTHLPSQWVEIHATAGTTNILNKSPERFWGCVPSEARGAPRTYPDPRGILQGRRKMLLQRQTQKKQVPRAEIRK